MMVLVVIYPDYHHHSTYHNQVPLDIGSCIYCTCLVAASQSFSKTVVHFSLSLSLSLSHTHSLSHSPSLFLSLSLPPSPSPSLSLPLSLSLSPSLSLPLSLSLSLSSSPSLSLPPSPSLSLPPSLSLSIYLSDPSLAPIHHRPVTGVAILWQPEIVIPYLAVMEKYTSNNDLVEAATGAIQNLTACSWKVSNKHLLSSIHTLTS